MDKEQEAIVASALEIAASGSMTPEQFDKYVDSLIKLLQACGVK